MNQSSGFLTRVSGWLQYPFVNRMSALDWFLVFILLVAVTTGWSRIFRHFDLEA